MKLRTSKAAEESKPASCDCTLCGVCPGTASGWLPCSAGNSTASANGHGAKSRVYCNWLYCSCFRLPLMLLLLQRRRISVQPEQPSQQASQYSTARHFEHSITRPPAFTAACSLSPEGAFRALCPQAKSLPYICGYRGSNGINCQAGSQQLLPCPPTVDR